jgi:hypothetical protein
MVLAPSYRWSAYNTPARHSPNPENIPDRGEPSVRSSCARGVVVPLGWNGDPTRLIPAEMVTVTVVTIRRAAVSVAGRAQQSSSAPRRGTAPHCARARAADNRA